MSEPAQTSERLAFLGRIGVELTQRLEIPFEPGPLEGPQDRDVGCVWWEGKRPFQRAGILEEDYYRARIFVRFVQEQGDPTIRGETHAQLITLSETVETTLQAILAAAGHAFFNVLEISPDYVRQSIEIQMTAYDRNRSSAGG